MTGRHEKPVIEALRTAAKLHGWLFYHTYDSRRSEPGFPDAILLRPPRMIAIEVKRDKDDKPTEAQFEWLRAFAEVKFVDSFVLRPGANYDELEEELR